MDSTFFFLADGGNIFAYFVQSNFAGKMIVFALLGFSLLAWTVMIGKYMDLMRIRQLNINLEADLQQKPAITAMPITKEYTQVGAYGPLVYNAMEAFKKPNATPKQKMDYVENALQRSVARQTINYESKMVLLASIVTGAPFLGLLGTVWGVMDAFGGIALGSGATLQSLAPGVSGALLTTVAGLLVAIPSVFGYNFLLTQTKIMVTELENFASLFADRLEREISAQMNNEPV